MGFPTQNDHFGVFWGYHHLRKHPNMYTPENEHMSPNNELQYFNKEIHTSSTPSIDFEGDIRSCSGEHLVLAVLSNHEWM